MSKKKLEPWKAGDPIQAARLNELQRIAERIDNASSGYAATSNDTFSATRSTSGPPIKFVRMTEAIGPVSATADNWYDRAGVVQTWNPTTLAFGDTAEVVEVVVDPTAGHIADINQIVPCVAHGGKLVAIGWQNVRHARTVAGGDTYPTAQDARVYKIRFTTNSYTDTVGGTAFTSADIGTAGTFDDYVCNIHSNAFIPEDTDIWVYRVGTQWFTCYSHAVKDWARATFNTALTSATATVAGTLVTQYGSGADHTDTSVTLHNLETSTPGLYVFSGVSGAACWAKYAGYGDHWLIVIPQCA